MTDETFAGFPVPTKNFFSMPNEMINIIAHIKNVAELKVIIYVIRHTWGFQEYGIYKTISADEFMHGRRRSDGTRMDEGTGLSHHSVIDGLRAAVQHGYLICDVDGSDLARVKKSYSLRMIGSSEDVAPGAESAPPEDVAPGAESAASSADSASGSAESAHRSEKDTIRNTPKKDTRESVAPASLSAFAERKKATNPEMPAITQEMLAEKVIPPKITLPSKHTPPSQSQVRGIPDMQAPPASVGKGTAQTGAGAGKRTRKPKTEDEQAPGPPQMPPEDEWTTTTCLRLFDYWRGAPQLDLGQIKYAASCAKNLAASYNREQVTRVRTVMNEDPYWIERGGADICDVARHMSKEWNKLQKMRKPTPIRRSNELPEFTEEEYQRLKETAP